MALDAIRLRQQGVEVAALLRRMAVHGRVLFKTNRVFKGLCIATPCLLVFWTLFGGSGGSATGSAPAPPPIIVGPNSVVSGTAPYQFGSPQQAPDPASIQRQQVLAALSDSLRNEPRTGYKCEKLAAAVQTLTGQDRAQPLPQAVGAIGDADGCRALIEVSNTRFAALSQAAAAFQADETPLTAAALSRAGQAMTTFDHSRELADRSQGLFDAAQTATTLLQDSDGRLHAFADAERGMSAGPPLDAQTRLVGAATALTSFDRLRLSPAQRATDKLAADLAEQFQESDRRIDRAVQQADLPAQDATEADKAALVDAIGALTKRDLQRASPSQKEALDRGTAAAQTVAMAMLLAIMPRLDVASPLVDEQAARIRRLIGPIDPKSLTTDQERALFLADRAAARIRASDTRLDDMQAAVEAWRKSPSPMAGGQVSNAYKAIIDYDRARFTTVRQDTYAQLETAYYIAAGKSIGLTAATRAKLPIFVVVRDAGGGPEDALATTMATALGRSGYRLADSRAGAAMLLELTAKILGQNTVETSIATLQTAISSAELRAAWVTDRSEFDRETARANGQGGNGGQAVAASYQDAAGRLAERFSRFVETGERQ
jgi:hypothetical protein